MQITTSLLRHIPNVNDCLLALADKEELANVPIARVKRGVRLFLDQIRQSLIAGTMSEQERLQLPELLPQMITFIQRLHKPKLRRVINGTGVIVHTNLGRSLLPRETMDTLLHTGIHYANLEFDLQTGKRGSRYSLVEEILCELTGAEAALVVNNNAAAVLICLDTLAKGREAIVSRGQLVEIGGSFRIPDVMQRSGARLREVGATNRTHLHDYEEAIGEETSLLLKVHCSNFRIVGFTKEVDNQALVALGNRFGIPVMEDLGSGCLVDLTPFGLEREPTVREVVASGVDVVTFSGDKLLGGPQAGIILGRRTIIDRIKRNPLNRALRIDKFTLAGLESVLRIYLDSQSAFAKIPTLRMIAAPAGDMEKKVDDLMALLDGQLADTCILEKVTTMSRVGGGALPEQNIRSWALALTPQAMSISMLEEQLRQGDIAVVGRVEHERFLLDLRTVDEDELALLAALLAKVLSSSETAT